MDEGDITRRTQQASTAFGYLWNRVFCNQKQLSPLFATASSWQISWTLFYRTVKTWLCWWNTATSVILLQRMDSGHDNWIKRFISLLSTFSKMVRFAPYKRTLSSIQFKLILNKELGYRLDNIKFLRNLQPPIPNNWFDQLANMPAANTRNSLPWKLLEVWCCIIAEFQLAAWNN